MSSPDLARIVYGLPEPTLLVSPGGRILAANPAAGRLLEQTAAELVGMSLSSFATDPAGATQYLHACLRNSEGIPGGFRLQISHRRSVQCKAVGAVAQLKDGEACLAWIRLVPRESANSQIVVYNERLQALKKEINAFQLSEERWRTAFENSAIGIAMTDLQGRFLVANSAYQAMLGYTEEELQTLSIIDITHEGDREFNWKMVKELLDGNRQRFQIEKRYLRKDGTVIWVRLNASMVPERGSVPPYLLGVVEDITERKHAEAARRQTEEQYRSVVDAVTEAVVSVDETSHIMFANPATTKIFGYISSELIGQPLTMLMPEYMRELHNAGFRRYVTTGQRHINWQGVEFVGLRKNGEEFPVEVSFGEIIKNSHRAFTGFIRDISEWKQAEELRTAQSRQAALRAEVSTAFATGDNLRAILQGCAEAVVRQVKAAFARIWTLNKDENVLELQASAGMYTRLDGAYSRVPVRELKIGLIAQERKPHLTNDVVNDPRISDKVWAKNEGMVAFAGYPLVVEDRVVGVIALFSCSALTTTTLDTLASIADSVAQGIVRKQAEQKVRNSERSLRLLTETIPQMLWSATPDGAIDYCNERVLEYTGLSEDEIQCAGWLKAVHIEDADRIEKLWVSAVSTGIPYQAEFRGLHAADNTYRWCVASALPLRDREGHVLKWYGSVVDLEDWKRAQEALQQSEERFRLLVAGVQDYAICMLDPEGRIVTWNVGAERVKGYASDEILGQHFSLFYEVVDIEQGKPREALIQAAQNGHFKEEGWRLRKDGSRFWADVVVTAIRKDDGGLLGFSTLTRDLTERKRLEQELKYERDRLRLLLDLNNRVVSNLDLPQLFKTLSGELMRIMKCDVVGLALPDSDNKHLRLQFVNYAGTPRERWVGTAIPIDGSPSGAAFKKARIVLVDSVEKLHLHPELYEGAGGEAFDRAVTGGLRAGCYLPLIVRNRVLGVLQMARAEERSFGREEVDFLSQVATQIAIAVDNALSYQKVSESRERLASEKRYLEEEIHKEYNFEEIVGSSPPLQELLRKVLLAAPSGSSVLISGETGTGKELVARAVHARSSRKDRPLIKVNCGSIPAGLVESELFGHVKGAFTGASSNRTGRFELADGGTLFLDEVGELLLETQVKLLRVLQEQEFEPVGSSRTIHVDVRIIAATNRDLEEAVRSGQFRSDLYYRLNVLPLVVPSLRERREDIPQIVMFFLDRFSKKAGKKIESISPETMERLVDYPWPGNVRELQNVIERGVVLSNTSVLALGPDLLPLGEPARGSAGNEREPRPGLASKVPRTEALPSEAFSLEEMEKQHILAVLKQTDGRINGPNGAAAILKINPNTLRSRMKKIGISRAHCIS